MAWYCTVVIFAHLVDVGSLNFAHLLCERAKRAMVQVDIAFSQPEASQQCVSKWGLVLCTRSSPGFLCSHDCARKHKHQQKRPHYASTHYVGSGCLTHIHTQNELSLSEGI